MDGAKDGEEVRPMLTLGMNESRKPYYLPMPITGGGGSLCYKHEHGPSVQGVGKFVNLSVAPGGNSSYGCKGLGQSGFK